MLLGFVNLILNCLLITNQDKVCFSIGGNHCKTAKDINFKYILILINENRCIVVALCNLAHLERKTVTNVRVVKSKKIMMRFCHALEECVIKIFC